MPDPIPPSEPVDPNLADPAKKEEAKPPVKRKRRRAWLMVVLGVVLLLALLTVFAPHIASTAMVRPGNSSPSGFGHACAIDPHTRRFGSAVT